MIISLCIISFVAALVAHLMWWRIVGEGNSKTLLLIFLTSYAFVFSVAGSSGLSISLSDWIAAGLFCFSLAVFYITNYSTVAAESPMLWLLRSLSEAEHEGIAEEELFRRFAELRTFDDRFQKLVDDGLVTLQDGRVRVGTAKSPFLRCIIWFRFLFLGEK